MYSVAVVLAGIFLVPSFAAETCIPSSSPEYSSCSCKFESSGQYINLAPLQNSSRIPRFNTSTTSGKGEEGWVFSYNPCKPFSMFLEANLTSSCKDVAAARWTSPPRDPSRSVCQDLGEQKTIKYSTKPYNLTEYDLEYSNITLIFSTQKEIKLSNRAIIHLVCNENMTKEDSIFSFLKEDHSVLNDYYFTLESPCACPGLCGKPPTPPKPTVKPPAGQNGKWLIIGVSIGAVVVLLLIIATALCCWRRRRGYAQV